MNLKGLIFLLFLTLQLPALFGQAQSAEELYEKALGYKNERKCSDAIGLLTKAISLKPDYTDALYELGWCYNELKDYSGALAVLLKAIQQSPRNYKIIYEAGFANANLGKKEEAFNLYRQAIELNPSFVQAYLARGDLFREADEKHEEALKDYLKAAQLDSTSTKANYWTGWCYNDLQQYTKAIPFLQKAASADKQNYLPHSELGFSFYSLKQYDEALAYLKSAELLKPKAETVVYYSGLCYVKKGLKAEAVKKYNELVMQSSEYAIILLNEIKNMK
jgi:tetratricopeptide (TPR) repeat protein